MNTRDDMSGPGVAVPLSEQETLPGAPPVVSEHLPAQLGRYKIERRLGAGGMGVVYAAQDPELGRTVAIKLVGERIGSQGGLQERLRREAQALARLSHPHVVSVYDVGVADGQLFIVMQYVDRVSLEAWLETHKPERSRIIAMFVQAGRGLAAAHAAGLVHRDFKPSNVLVEEDGTVRVTDFGLARLSDLADPEGPGASGPGGASLETSITRGDVVGTPAYMAPEQFRGGPITGATDQFGFCAALWEALTGIRPFPGENVDTIRNALLAGTIPAERARGLPRSLERILRRGLSVSMQDRYPSMGALLDALTPSRRGPWLAAALAVAVVVAVAAVVLARGSDAPCADAACQTESPG